MLRFMSWALVICWCGLALGLAGCDGGGNSMTPPINPPGNHNPSSISLISPSGEYRVEVGKTLALTARAVNAKGDVVVPETLTWESSNPAVATVDGNGLVTGVTVGEVSITVCEPTSGCTSMAAVTVYTTPDDPPVCIDGLVARISVDPSSASGTVGQTFTFRVCAREKCTQAVVPEFLSRWDYDGDGEYDTSFSREQDTTHSYTCKGAYTLRVEIKDEAGRTATAEKVIFVTAIPCPPPNNNAD